MKTVLKFYLFGCICFASLLLFCIDDLNQPTPVTPDQITITFSEPDAKKNGMPFKIGDQIKQLIVITNPYTIDTLIVDYGEPNNPNNIDRIPNPSSSTKEHTYHAKFTYLETGKKTITATLIFKQKFSFSKKTASSKALEIGVEPKIREKLIKCSTDQLFVGAACTLSVEVIEYGTTEYRWEKNNVAIAGETRKKVIFNSITNTNAGTYKCYAKNEYGADTSKECVLSITTNPKPLITLHPQNQQVTIGKSVSFKCTAIPENVKYQWIRNGVDIPNETNTTYTIPSVSEEDGNIKVKCKVSNDNGAVESNEAVLKVFGTEQKPEITKHPASLTLAKGDRALFTIEANGTNLVYQWQKNETDIPTGTMKSIQTDPVTEKDNGTKFRCKVYNSAGSETSTEAILTVQGLDDHIKPQIIQEPSDVEVTEGGDATFQVIANGKNLKYQWKCNGKTINGETTDRYRISGIKKSDNGSKYSCEITNAIGSVTSREALIKVVDKIEKITISKQPQNQVVKKGESAKFSVTVTGTNPTYQWQKNGSDIPGATSESFTTNAAEKTDNNTKYKCIIKNSASSVTTDEVSVTVHYIEFIKHPAEQTAEVGKSAKFSVEVSTNPTPLYQWLRNSSEIPGATTESYTKSDITLEDNNSEYSCRIKLENSQVTETSQPAKLLVKDGAITINSQLQNQKVKLGESITLTIEASGSNLKYQWLKNGNPLGNNEKTLQFTPEKTDNNATIKCVVSNSTDKKESNSITITLEWPPVISTQPMSTEANEGGQVTFSISMSDEGNPRCTYQWYYNGSISQNATNKTLQFVAKRDYNNSTYYCKAKNSAGEVQSQTATLKVYYLYFTQHPQNPGQIEPKTINLSASATGNPSSITYNWTKAGSSVGSGPSISLSVTESDKGKQVLCIASNGKLTAQSNPVILNVVKPNTAPVWNSTPSGDITTKDWSDDLTKYCTDADQGDRLTFTGSPQNISNSDFVFTMTVQPQGTVVFHATSGMGDWQMAYQASDGKTTTRVVGQYKFTIHRGVELLKMTKFQEK